MDIFPLLSMIIYGHDRENTQSLPPTETPF